MTLSVTLASLHESLRAFPRTSWRFALTILLVCGAVIYSTGTISQWVLARVERTWLEDYQTSPAPFGEGQLAIALLQRTPRAEWETTLAGVSAATRGAMRFTLMSFEQVRAEPGITERSLQAIDAGNSVMSRVFTTRAQETFITYQRLPQQDLVLRATTLNHFYYSPEELAAAERAARFRSIARMVTIGLIVLLCLVPFFWESRRLLRATQAFGRGEFDHRVKLPPIASLKPIGDALNLLASRVQELLASHKSLVNAAAHELRTPLTRLRYAHRLASETNDTVERTAMLRQIERDLGLLDGLVEELLFYARLDHEGSAGIRPASFALKPWITRRVGDARLLAASRQRDVTIHVDVGTDALVADADALGRALDNLLSNAIMHAASDVRVSIRDANGQASLTVEDDGPGIPEQDRARVFEPFVRLDDARTADVDANSIAIPHSGLGLAIVASVARLHGGSAWVESAANGGARICLRWPTSAPSKPSPSLSHL